MTTDLHPCPKCQTPMRTIERSGIHIETCPDCRGIFLDRGELDRLLDLEAATLVRRGPAIAASMGGAGAATTSLPPVPAAPPYPSSPDAAWQQPPAGWDRSRRDWDDDDDDDDRYERRGWDRERDGRDGRGRRRRGGFLGELLEGFGD